MQSDAEESRLKNVEYPRAEVRVRELYIKND